MSVITRILLGAVATTALLAGTTLTHAQAQSPIARTCITPLPGAGEADRYLRKIGPAGSTV